MKKILFLFSAFAIILVANISIAQSNSGSDFGADTRQNVPSWTTGGLSASNSDSKPVIPQELDIALKQALIDNNQTEVTRIQKEIDRVGGAEIRKQQIQTFDKDLPVYNNTPGAPFSPDWMPNDVLVSRDSLSQYALYPIRLKYGEDGCMYMGLNKSASAGRFGLIEIWRSNNGGLNWSLVSGVSGPAAYFGDFDMLIENKGGAILDSTRIILLYSRSTATNQSSSTLRWFSVRRDGTAPLGGSDVAIPSIANRKLTYVSAVSDGIYYGASTYIGVVCAELSNVNDSAKSLRMFRSVDWGTTWVGATYNTFATDAMGINYYNLPFSASLKPGVIFANDSVFIAVEQSPVGSGYTDIKVVKVSFNPNSSFTSGIVTSAAAGVYYSEPIIAIQQNDRAAAKNIIITCMKSGTGVAAMGGNVRAKYHQSVNGGATWTTDLLLDNRGGVGSPNIGSTCIVADSSSVGNFLAIFTTQDSINIRRGIPGNLGTATYKRNTRTQMSYTSVCSFYKSGNAKYSSVAYATVNTFSSPDSTMFNQENLPTWVSNEISVAGNYSLGQNYPNPFNPLTKIFYSIPKNEKVKIVVYNLLGSTVVELVNEEKTSGNYEVNFDAKHLPSGIYFYKIISGEFTETKKMMLIK